MNTRLVCAALGAWALAALPAQGQGVAEPHFCGDAQPLPACSTFIVFEAGAGYRARRGAGELDLSWHAGVLSNRGRSAVGATAFFATDLDGERGWFSSRVGLLPRYRRWLSRTASVDLSAGPVLEVGRRQPALGATAEVAVGWGNDIAITGRLDVGGRTGVGWVGGVKLGSKQASNGIEAEAVALVVYGLIALVRWVGTIDDCIFWCGNPLD